MLIVTIACTHSISAPDQTMSEEWKCELAKVTTLMTDDEQRSLQNLLGTNAEQESLEAITEMSDAVREKNSLIIMKTEWMKY